jgi:hypothetical protein
VSSSRRLFLQDATLALATVMFPMGGLSQNQLHDQSDVFNPENLTIFFGVSSQTFEQWIGSSFRVSLGKQSQGSLLLASVKVTEAAKSQAREGITFQPGAGVIFGSLKQPSVASFSLHFQRSGTPLQQNTYLLDHNWLGTFPLFLVPSGLSARLSTCTAVFSLLGKIAAT